MRTRTRPCSLTCYEDEDEEAFRARCEALFADVLLGGSPISRIGGCAICMRTIITIIIITTAAGRHAWTVDKL